MTAETYGLTQFVADLQAIASETTDDMAIIGRVRPLAQRLAGQPDWLSRDHYACDSEQGNGLHLLHEEPDHRLAVFAVSWLPGRGTPPHDHGTWAVVAGVDGAERNVFWRCLDDGSRSGHAEIVENGESTVGPGEVIALRPDDIHSVVNDGDQVTVSLHVYGMHVNHTGRSEFDPETNRVRKYVVTVD